jgi:hypothetical protein
MATFRAGMVPPMPDEGAPGPMSHAKRMDKVVIGSKKDLKPGDRRMLEPVLDPVEGEEVGMEEKKAKVYKKKFASGGYTKAADGCVQRGKTRGKMV